jgi:peptide/nickel transport system substrate-binding protein
MQHRSIRALGGGILALTLLAAACGGGGDDDSDDAQDPDQTGTSAPDAGPPQAGGTLVYGLAAETNSWDPAAGTWSNSGWTVGRAIYDSLVMYDEDLQWRPYLAEAIEPNDDYSEWTITTREGVNFHNGQPLDAEAVKLNIDRHIASPLTGSVFDPVEEVEVIDDRTVVITLDRSWVRFPSILSGQPGLMVAPEMIEDPDGGANPIGTGPFVFESWSVDDELIVTRNEDYWRDPTYLDGITFKVITDHQTRAIALRNEELDAATISLANDLVDFQDEMESEGWQMLEPSGETPETFFLLNQEHPPLDDRRVREALVLATDTQTIIDTLREGFVERADGMYPTDSPWYVDTGYPEPDPERAAELVAEYEAETGEELSFTIGSPQEAATLEFIQFVQEQWDLAGIETEIKTLEATEYITSTVTGDYEINVWAFYSSPHPDGEYTWLHSSFAKPIGELSLNFERIRDDEIDAALDEGRSSDDPERHEELYAAVQQRMTDELYHVWLYHDRSATVAHPDLHDVLAWDFPDGTPGSGMINVQPWFTAAWMEQ